MATQDKTVVRVAKKSKERIMAQQDLYQGVYLKRCCPECGEKAIEIDKDTSSGRDIRFYACSVCQWNDFIDVGIALWQAYSSANTDDKSSGETQP
jgi:predicted RNA-binding Zn-ribbon protein involved in translation (DUF1610 family)